MKTYALTRTSDAGKTSLLRVLYEQGFAVVEDAATEVIHREKNEDMAEAAIHWNTDLPLFRRNWTIAGCR